MPVKPVPIKIFDKSVVLHLLSLLHSVAICPGHPDEPLLEMAMAKKEQTCVN